MNGLRLTGRRLGVGRYLEYMLRYWAELDHPFEEIRVYVPETPDDAFLADPTVRFRELGPTPGRAVWEHLVLPLRKPADDVFFCPSYTVPLFNRHRPVVVTHHGSYEAIPEAFPLLDRARARAVNQLSCRRADRVITVSESSRRDIVRFYGLSRDKIEVIPEGVDDAFRTLDDPERLTARRQSYFDDGRPYVLFVGKLSERRNIPELLEGFALLIERQDIDHGLVLVGPDTSDQRPLRQADALGIRDRVRHRTFSDHDELVEAYNAADAFVYPSSYEGFGIPVLEAMACGVPAVTLDNSAFPEFADGIAVFARDTTPSGLADGLETALFSNDVRRTAREEGPRRASEYRWRDIAERTLRLLARTAEDHA